MFYHWWLNAANVALVVYYNIYGSAESMHVKDRSYSIPITKGCFVPRRVLVKKIFKCQQYFHYFILFEKGAPPPLYISLNPLNPRMICAKFCWNWRNGSGEDFQMLITHFHYSRSLSFEQAAMAAQWVRAFVPQAEGWVFEFQPRQTYM